jgi:hypothetical protein
MGNRLKKDSIETYQAYERNDSWMFIKGRKNLSFDFIEDVLLFFILYPAIFTIFWNSTGITISFMDTAIVLISLGLCTLMRRFLANHLLFISGHMVIFLLAVLIIPFGVSNWLIILAFGIIIVRSVYIHFLKEQRYFNTSFYIGGQILLILFYLINSGRSTPFMLAFLTAFSVFFTVFSVAYISYVRNRVQNKSNRGNQLFEDKFNSINLRSTIIIGIFLLLVFGLAEILQLFTVMDRIEQKISLPRFTISTKENSHADPVIKKNINSSNVTRPFAEKNTSPIPDWVVYILGGAGVIVVFILLKAGINNLKGGKKENKELTERAETEPIKEKISIKKSSPVLDISLKLKMRKIYRAFIMDRYYTAVKIKQEDTTGDIDRAVKETLGEDIREVSEIYEKIRYGSEAPEKKDFIKLKKLAKKEK